MNRQQIEAKLAAMNYYEREVLVFLLAYHCERQERARRNSVVDAHLRAIARSVLRS